VRTGIFGRGIDVINARKEKKRMQKFIMTLIVSGINARKWSEASRRDINRRRGIGSASSAKMLILPGGMSATGVTIRDLTEKI
jgi:hypothetical protein